MEEMEREPIAGVRGRHGAQNLVVLGGQLVAWAMLLSVVDRQSLPLGARIVAVIAFCLVMQGVFSMMHEFFHRNAHGDGRVNDVIGVVASTLFMTSATLHRINHWGHHVRNRTAAERGEFIHEGESAVGKVLLYYAATMGGLWLGGLLFPIASLFIPFSAVTWLGSSPRFNTYRAAFRQFARSDWTRMRLEALLVVALWSAIVVADVWRFQTVVVCYAAFAYSWSALQWIYHLRTPLHPVEGTYNLRLPTPLRWLFLNFNCNLTHHRHPELPWQELHRQSDPRETQPLWFRWLLMFLPPRRFPEDTSSLAKRYF